MNRSTDSCRHCGGPLEEDELFCGQCGRPVKAEEEPPRAEPAGAPASGKRRWFRYAIIALILVAVLGSVYLFRKKILPGSPVPDTGQQEALSRPAPVPPPEIPLPQPIPQPPPLSQPSPDKARDLKYYETSAADAFKKRKCGVLKNVLDQGLGIYPNSSKLWGGVAGYNIVCRPDLPAAVRGQRALNAALRAYQLDSSDQNAVNVGWIYQSMAGDWYRAVVYYEKGVQFADRDPSLYYHMGQCYEALRNAPKAIESYQLFLRVAPNHRYAADARLRLSALGG
jgi:hypothetical protein